MKALLESRWNVREQRRGRTTQAVPWGTSPSKSLCGRGPAAQLRELEPNLADETRRRAGQQRLAEQMVQVVGRLHDWLLIEEAEGGERGEWFWRGLGAAGVAPGHGRAVTGLVAPGREQWAGGAGLEGAQLCHGSQQPGRAAGDHQGADPAAGIGDAACPLPIWIPQGQRELAERGLAAILRSDPLSDAQLQQGLEWLGLMTSSEKAATTAVERDADQKAEEGSPLQQLFEGFQRLGLEHLLPAAIRRQLEQSDQAPPALLPPEDPALCSEALGERLPDGIAESVLKKAETLLLSNQRQKALDLLANHLPPWVSETQRAATARLVATMQLSRCGAWKEAESLHSEAVRAVAAGQLSPEALAAELAILRTEGELLSHELSLALSHGSLASATSPAPTEAQGDDSPRWQSLSRSQLEQDLWVLEQLDWKRNGFFVEFGATDGVLLSNTWLLEKHFNWRGICAEPNPKLFARLQMNRSCHLSPACVYRSSGERMRFVLADAYGGLEDLGRNDQHAEKRNAYAAVGEVIEATTTSLMDLLDQQEAPAVIDYLSIDTEGSELAILEGIDWCRYQFRCITVEHNFTEQRQGIQQLLEAQGYQRREAQWDDWYWKEIG